MKKIYVDSFCDNCLFWERKTQAEGLGTEGYCRRNAPRSFRITKVEYQESTHGVFGFPHIAAWPETFEWDWCGQGQWEDKEEKS